ncbi:MAG: helix-turn-helix domain-containing protein [Prolixibacteraceae bacterium]|nr:helix-turn-helix domain-containing protein [Prolixibacteraceae bacterium]
MGTLKYTVIKNDEQYKIYCEILEELVNSGDKAIDDEIELLTLLIEKWDNEHTIFNDSDPIVILTALMEEHDLKAKDLAEILNLTKGTISKILNYNKGLSKDTIRRLSDYFKLSQEAFNRPYRLNSEESKHFQNFKIQNKRNKMIEA